MSHVSWTQWIFLTNFRERSWLSMAKTQRVVFSFDERSLESLQKIKEQGRFTSMGEAVRESLQISRALQSQATQGFSEIVVRNPETREERVIVVPALQVSTK
jgi:hypothetical protein